MQICTELTAGQTSHAPVSGKRLSSRATCQLRCTAAMALRRERARCGTHTSLPLAVGHYGVVPIGHQHLAHRGSVVVAIPALGWLSTLLPLWPC